MHAFGEVARCAGQTAYTWHQMPHTRVGQLVPTRCPHRAIAVVPYAYELLVLAVPAMLAVAAGTLTFIFVLIDDGSEERHGGADSPA
jgi:hypothetical protein